MRKALSFSILFSVVFILSGVFFEVRAVEIDRTKVVPIEQLRAIDAQIIQQEEKTSKAEQDLLNAQKVGDSSDAQAAQAVLQAAQELIDSLLKQRSQLTAPLL